MCAAIEPGMYVECIEDDFDVMGEIRRGVVYRVTEVYPEAASEECSIHGFGCPAPGVDIEGFAIDEDRCWCADCFRPVYRPNADLIRQLLAPAPDAPAKICEPA